MARRFTPCCLPTVMLAGLSLLGCSSGPPQPGTSVVILVDFSRSFAPLGRADVRALNAATGALAELAARSSPPVTFYWSRIETRSVLSEPLCKPVRQDPKLIHKEGDLDMAGLRAQLAACGESIVKASADATQQSQYTDIRGALALANENTSGKASERVFVVFSDFLEELPQGKPAEYKLNGARILLLHRSGSDSRESTTEAHSALMARWVAEMRENGAAAVVALPIFGATEYRVAQGLSAGAKTAGTAVSVIVDTLYSSAEGLGAIAQGVARLAPDWPPPVTVTWFAVGGSALTAQPLPPVEFAPRLVKRAGLLSTREEFFSILEECARSTARWRRLEGTADISGMIALLQGAGQFEAQHVLIVVSDLRGPGTLSVPLTGSVVMISTPSAADGGDQQGYFSRLDRWKRMFHDAGAANVCRIQLRNLTPSSLVDCHP